MQRSTLAGFSLKGDRMDNSGILCSQCKEKIVEDGHFDTGDSGLAFCQPQCEYQYYCDNGLPYDYDIPHHFAGRG